MAFIPTPNGALVTFDYSQADGSFAQNGVWVAGTADFTSTELAELALNAGSWWRNGSGSGNKPSALTSHDTQLVSVTARDMSVESGPVVVDTTDLPAAGESSDASMTLGLTWSLTSRTGLAGRSYRGRWFVVGAASSLLSSSVFNGIDPTQAANWVDAMNKLQEVLGALSPDNGPWAVSVCSKRHDNADRSAGVLTPITTWGFHNLLIDFQRRRAPAHNRHH